MKSNKFGKYLKACRGTSTSLQKLADFCGCSKPYLWDIEQGNTKPPQNYKRLNDIAECLKLSSEERQKLFDLACDKNDIPLDVKEIIKNNPEWIQKIRSERGER